MGEELMTQLLGKIVPDRGPSKVKLYRYLHVGLCLGSIGVSRGESI